MPNIHIEAVHAGKALRAARQHRKLTQLQVARRTGIAQDHISQVENGHRDISISTFIRLANGVRVEPWKVLRFAGTLEQEGGN
jgi:transcriptional regulator with XRE-family HTH domain